MTAATNQQLATDLVAAFLRGDMETVASCFASEAIWDLPGRSALSGVYKGPNEIVGFLARAFELSAGTLSVEIIDVLASDWGAVQVQYVRAGGAGTQARLDCVEVLAHEIVSGRITRTYHRSDPVAMEEFFGTA